MTTEEEFPEIIKDTPEKLLSESGRISAIKDLAEKANDLNIKAEAIEEVTINELTKNNNVLRRSNRFLMVGLCILLAMSIVNQYRSVYVSGPRLESVQKTVNGPLSDANTKLDELILFIEAIAPQICHNLEASGQDMPEFCKVDP